MKDPTSYPASVCLQRHLRNGIVLGSDPDCPILGDIARNRDIVFLGMIPHHRIPGMQNVTCHRAHSVACLGEQ